MYVYINVHTHKHCLRKTAWWTLMNHMQKPCKTLNTRTVSQKDACKSNSNPRWLGSVKPYFHAMVCGALWTLWTCFGMSVTTVQSYSSIPFPDKEKSRTASAIAKWPYSPIQLAPASSWLKRFLVRLWQRLDFGQKTHPNTGQITCLVLGDCGDIANESKMDTFAGRSRTGMDLFMIPATPVLLPVLPYCLKGCCAHCKAHQTILCWEGWKWPSPEW